MPDPASILVLRPVLSLLLIVLGVAWPLYGVLGYMMFVYLDVSLNFPIFSDWQAELALGLFVVVRCLLVPSAWRRLNPRQNPTILYFFGFTVCVAISYAAAWDWGWSWDRAFYIYIKSLFVAIPLLMVIQKKEHMVVTLWGMVAMYVLAAYQPFYNFLHGGPSSTQAYGDVFVANAGMLSGHVAMANNMNQMIPLAVCLVLYHRRFPLRVIAAACVGLFVVCLVITRSRGGTVGLLFILTLYFLLSKKKTRALIYLVVLSVLVFAGAALYLNIFVQTLGRVDSFNTEGRLIRIVHGIEMVRAGNLLGVGPGCYILASGKMFGHTMDAHNIYGEVIGDLGIPGTIFWALLIWSIYRSLIGSKRSFAASTEEGDRRFAHILNGILISLSARLFVSLGSHGLYIYYWYVIAVLAAASWEFRPEAQHTSDEAEPVGVEPQPTFP